MEQTLPPPGWGADSLTDFLENAHRNRFATFANKKDWFHRLAKIDQCFMRVAKDWLNPSDMITPLLFFRCHSAYRAACEHALAGQVTDTFPQIRASLEYAGYALHIHKNVGLGERWLRRHDDIDTMKAVKNEFKISNIRATIGKVNRVAAEVFYKLYQRSIDFGGHPRVQTHSNPITNKSCKAKGGEEVSRVFVVTGGDTPEILEASEHAFNDVAALVPDFVERMRFLSIGPIRNDGLDTPRFQIDPPMIGVIRFIPQQITGIRQRRA